MQREQPKRNLDLLMMEQHITAVHDGDDGYIAVCSITADGKFHQHHYRLEKLLSSLGIIGLEGETNLYITPNSFYKTERRIENVRQIRALYADIDCHHLDPYQIECTIKDVITFLNTCSNESIPPPSFMVMTGRGLQLYWLIEHLPKQGVPLWQIVEDAITARLTELLQQLDVIVDNVGDIARILRLAGTNNTKSNTMATLIIQELTMYRLDGLIRDYFPELNILDKPKKKNAPRSNQIARVNRLYSLYSLHYTRLLDLVKLLELRKGRINSDECRRRMVFLYRYWSCCFTRDPQKALEDTLEFNKEFTCPLPSKVVESNTRSAEQAYFDWLSGKMTMYNGELKRMGYNYRNSTLIKWLGITPEEQREMETIIGTEEKYRRKNNRRSGRDESGLTAKQRERQERDQRILEMHEQGISNREIGRQINVDEKTVRNILKVRNF